MTNKLGNITKKQQQAENEKVVFQKGMQAGASLIFQSFVGYTGILPLDAEQTSQAEQVLREWVEDGSVGLIKDAAECEAFNQSVFQIFATIKEGIYQRLQGQKENITIVDTSKEDDTE